MGDLRKLVGVEIRPAIEGPWKNGPSLTWWGMVVVFFLLLVAGVVAGLCL